MKTFFIIAISLMLSGCTSARMYASAALQKAQEAEDFKLDAIKVSLCATPFSALARHPEFAEAVKVLCTNQSGLTAGEVLQGVKK